MSIEDTKQELQDELNNLPVEDSKSERPVLTHKTCIKCAEKKTIQNFQPLTMNLKGQINYSGKCRVCVASYKRAQYIEKHPNASNKRGPKSQFDDPVTKAKVIAELASGASIRSIAIKLGYGYNTLYMAHKNGKFN